MRTHTADGWTIQNDDEYITIYEVEQLGLEWEQRVCVPKATFAKLLAGVSDGIGVTVRTSGDPTAKAAAMEAVKAGTDKALRDGTIKIPERVAT